MGNITKNISSHELQCKCSDPECNVTILDNEPVIGIVQDACDYFARKNGIDKVQLEITSAARCYRYNRSDHIGSNDNSQHPRARAMDIKLFIGDMQIEPWLVYRYLDQKFPHTLGLGVYNTFTHVDSRTAKARWGNR